MYCKNCGKQIEDFSDYCIYCASEQPTISAEEDIIQNNEPIFSDLMVAEPTLAPTKVVANKITEIAPQSMLDGLNNFNNMVAESLNESGIPVDNNPFTSTPNANLDSVNNQENTKQSKKDKKKKDKKSQTDAPQFVNCEMCDTPVSIQDGVCPICGTKIKK